MGAEAVLMPAFNPPESVSRITIVNNGPGFIPSIIPRVLPKNITPKIKLKSNLIP